MARLASQEKGGFYPLPPTVTELIATHVKAPHGGRLLDPCCGEGIALVTLAKELNLEPYGVELNIDRAKASAKLVNELLTEQGIEPSFRIIHGDYKLTLNTTQNGYNCLYLNPPYDTDHDAGRLEYKWLVETRPYLQADGLLIMVIPQPVLGFYKMAKYLAGWFHDTTVYRFPDPEYSRFKQIVVLAVKAKPVPPQYEEVQRIRDLAQSEWPIITRALTTINLPKLVVPREQFTFLNRYVDPGKAMQQAISSGIRKTDDWATHLAPSTQSVGVAPLMPLKVGHLVGLIAAGFLNNQILHNAQTGELLLIKGHAYKKTNLAEKVEKAESYWKKTTTATEQVVTSIQTINAAGVIEIVEPIQLEEFIKKWSSQLTNHIATNYPPRYTFNYQNFPFAHTVDSLSISRKIPRMDAWGLLPTQKHAVAALVIRLQSHNDAVLVGEMGTGKTTCGIATAAVLNAKRTLVICPPHLVDKWQREAKIVWPGIETMALTSISDVDHFFAKASDAPQLAVVAHSKAKLGSGWRHAYMLGKDAKGQTRCHCPDCGQALTDKHELPLSPASIQKIKHQLICENCGGIAYQFDRRRGKKEKPGSFAEYARREQIIRDCIEEEDEVPSFAENEGYARWPLARYIRQHHRGRIDLLLADEVHQFKAADSDQGYAFYDLVVASNKVLAMTGTIFGGKASSLFHLLYRTSPEVRRAYTDNDRAGKSRIRQKEWGEQYGVEQQIETVTVDEDGKMSGNSRSNIRIRELPGASPAMLPWLINRSVFVSLADMGFALPDYEEIPVTIEMSALMESRYQELYYKLYEELKDRLRHNDKSLLGAYVQALLCWVDSPWRDEVIIEPRSKNRENEGIEPVVLIQVAGIEQAGLFPKERAIIDLILDEKKAGRKSLLFCQQTVRRDITGRWVKILADAGLSAAVLKAEPTKREEWVAKQVEDGIDVIITHPRKVETGLDLMDFPTLIWMGIEYSSYTVMQASRRSWRIGQNEDVKVYFFCYAETLQEEALSLIASKIAATTRVNGDVIDGNSLADLDEFASTDMVSALTNVVTRSCKTQSLKDAFREANEAFRAGQEVIGDYRDCDKEKEQKEEEEEEEEKEKDIVHASNQYESDLPLFQFNYPPKANVNIPKGPANPIVHQLQLNLFETSIMPTTNGRKIPRKNSRHQPSKRIIQLSFM